MVFKILYLATPISIKVDMRKKFVWSNAYGVFLQVLFFLRCRAIVKFLVVHYNIAVEDERNVVYKSGGREQERGGRLVYLPNSSGSLEPFPSK